MNNPNTPNDHLFEITLTEQGKAWFLRTCKIVHWIFIGGLVLSVLCLVSLVLRYATYYSRYPANGTLTSVFAFKIYPLIELGLIVLNVVELFFYFRFSRLGRQGIELNQTEQFNESFKWLLKNTIVLIAMFVLQLVMISISLYAQVIQYMKEH